MRRGSANANWRGGRTRGGQDGRYVMLHFPDHPSANKAGYVLEHRVVTSRVIGRALTRGEVVHHMNGNTEDNRPENLQVLTQAEHARLHAADGLAAHPYIRPPAPRFEHICETCGQGFETVGSKTRLQRFCSRACYWTHRRGSGPLKKGVTA